MGAIARAGNDLVRGSGDAHGHELALSTGALAIGDVLTGTAGHVQLGVPAVRVDLHDVPRRGYEHDDNYDEGGAVILVGVRATRVVTWVSVPTAGVDSGIFGVWDAARPPGPGNSSHASTGFGGLLGRPVMALETGDGWFAAVAGKDVDGAVSVLVAGPGVDPRRFRVADPAELAARAALPLGADACPVTNWLLSGLDEATQALARTYAAAFAPPRNRRRARPRQLARLALVATWALRRWHALIAPLCPAEAGVLADITVPIEGGLDWLGPANHLLDLTMPARAFDREQELHRTIDRATIYAMYEQITAARQRRVGVAALQAIRANVQLDYGRKEMLKILCAALHCSLRHHAISGGPHDADAILDAVLTRLDEQLPPAALIRQLAECT
ncbi:hypothetical protein SAMN02745121_02810 [Nannocystis exedens]|uniref:Uncharacterized protein n=2 Tax=Nannocystis exedens TaxID=54 RepID=A0A1I1XEX7_9BACT|nr:hypothetical protein NAEX_06549 [Nannocystis exedens]SFE05964.1 hypothetical protein SAMN02745121_02810 [Nannocystis exedens]